MVWKISHSCESTVTMGWRMAAQIIGTITAYPACYLTDQNIWSSSLLVENNMVCHTLTMMKEVFFAHSRPIIAHSRPIIARDIAPCIVQQCFSILLILNEKLFTLFTLFTFDWTIHSFFRILEEIWKMHGAGAWSGKFCSLLRVLSILPNQPVKNQWSYQEKMERQSLLSNQAIFMLTEIRTTA